MNEPQRWKARVTDGRPAECGFGIRDRASASQPPGWELLVQCTGMGMANVCTPLPLCQDLFYILAKPDFRVPSCKAWDLQHIPWGVNNSSFHLLPEKNLLPQLSLGFNAWWMEKVFRKRKWDTPWVNLEKLQGPCEVSQGLIIIMAGLASWAFSKRRTDTLVPKGSWEILLALLKAA